MTPEDRLKWRDEQRTAVYRLYDQDGDLLYVGITYDVRERWRHHQKHKDWWSKVEYEQFRWYDTRPEAEKAETHAIVAGNPVHNKRRNEPWYKANYRIRWVRDRLEQARKDLCTPRRPRAKAKLAALAELEDNLRILEEHTPRWRFGEGQDTLPPGGVSVIVASRHGNGECPMCGGPVPCQVVKAMGQSYRDHPFYCL